MSKITIDNVLCKKCGLCTLLCPESIFVQENGSVPKLSRIEACISCGQCVAACPVEAISHKDFPKGSMTLVNQKIVPSAEQVLEILKARRSIRVFDEKPVEKEHIEKIIEGARFTPSAHNLQSTEFVVVQDITTLERIRELAVSRLAKTIKLLRNPLTRSLAFLKLGKNTTKNALHLLPSLEMLVDNTSNGKDKLLFNAPCLIILHAEDSVLFAEVNANLALQNASLISHALGLGSMYSGIIVRVAHVDRSIARLLSIPDNHQIYAALTIGYPRIKYHYRIERKIPRVRWVQGARNSQGRH